MLAFAFAALGLSFWLAIGAMIGLGIWTMNRHANTQSVGERVFTLAWSTIAGSFYAAVSLLIVAGLAGWLA